MHPFFLALKRKPISLSGSLSGSAIGASTVQGNPCNITVPTGSSGQIRFDSVANTGTGNVQYSKNAGAFTTVTSGSTVTFANGDNIQMQATGLLSSGQGGTATLYDVTAGRAIGTYTWNRS